MQEPHTEQVSYFKFVMFCAVLVGLILFSMVFGGYSSFIRAENRIAESKDALLGSCEARLALIAELTMILDSQALSGNSSSLLPNLERASAVVREAARGKTILDEQTTRSLEASQSALTRDIGEQMQRLRAAVGGENRAEVLSLAEKFLAAEDNLFLAGSNYREEIAYYNMRLQSFPVSLIARLFDFDKSVYHQVSDQAFLPARKTLQPYLTEKRENS